MKTRVKWVQNRTFLGKSQSGHGVVMDTNEKFGGENLGASPMELVLMAVGGCSSIDVVGILQKSRQDVHGCWVELEAEQAPEPPKVFTKIHMHYVIEGHDIDSKKVEEAIKLSKEKYCSVSIMVGHTAEFTSDFEIVLPQE